MFQFGCSALFARPTTGYVGAPVLSPQRFGTLQDVNIDIDRKLVELRGQDIDPDDVAAGDRTIKFKAGVGKIEVEFYNALFFGDTISPGGVSLVIDEDITASPTVTVAHSATFASNLSVRYADGSGDLQMTTASPTVIGTYSVVETGGGKGVYTFFGSDIGKDLLFCYTVTVATGRTLNVVNRPLGYGVAFEMYCMQGYQEVNGTPNDMLFYACKCSKMNAPMKRDGYMIADIEGMCYANPARKTFDWFQVAG